MFGNYAYCTRTSYDIKLSKTVLTTPIWEHDCFVRSFGFDTFLHCKLSVSKTLLPKALVVVVWDVGNNKLKPK